MSIGSDYLRDGMSSSAVETQETRAQSVKVTGEALTVDLVDGRTIIVPLVWFPRLWHGNPRERSHFEMFGQGRYIHWPDLDEDLTVTGLLAGRQSGESLESLEKWPVTSVAHARPTQPRGTPNKNGRGREWRTRESSTSSGAGRIRSQQSMGSAINEETGASIRSMGTTQYTDQRPSLHRPNGPDIR